MEGVPAFLAQRLVKYVLKKEEQSGDSYACHKLCECLMMKWKLLWTLYFISQNVHFKEISNDVLHDEVALQECPYLPYSPYLDD